MAVLTKHWTHRMRAFSLAATFVLAGLWASPAHAGPMLRGIVQSGGTALARPLADVEVALLDAGSTRAAIVGRTRTDAAGRFEIAAPGERAAGVFYLRATLAGGVEWLSVVGPALRPSVTVNELTSVAASYRRASR